MYIEKGGRFKMQVGTKRHFLFSKWVANEWVGPNNTGIFLYLRNDHTCRLLEPYSLDSIELTPSFLLSDTGLHYRPVEILQQEIGSTSGRPQTD